VNAPLFATDFVVFGTSHLVAIALTLVVAAALPVIVKRAESDGVVRATTWTLAAALVANDVFRCGYIVTFRGWDTFVELYLPLHFCGLATYLTAFTLVVRRQIPYEVAYYWGLSGAALAILTPAIEEGYPSFEFFTFFVGHGGIVVGVCFATFALGMRPRFIGVWITVIVSVGVSIFIGTINQLLGSNYMFTHEAPKSASPLFFLAWPWYIPFIALVAIVLFHLLWLPWGIGRRIRGEKS
jgi:hypothetical integral membrane protein (TIGR02206 family)